jgi:hypothetical protein
MKPSIAPCGRKYGNPLLGKKRAEEQGKQGETLLLFPTPGHPTPYTPIKEVV